MNETITNNNIYNSCGKSFNAINSDIVNNVLVDDDYVIKEAVFWIAQNIRLYKFVGKKAKNIMQKIISFNNGALSQNETSELLSEFFSIYINNLFSFENGLEILEDSYITSCYLKCYFVKFKKNINIPIGCMEEFGHAKTNGVIEEYIGNCQTELKKFTDNISSSISYFESRVNSTSKNKAASIQRAILSAFIFLFGLIFIVECGSKIDWQNFWNICIRSANLFQIIGFLTEKKFVIGHNCSLVHIILILAVFWLIYLMFTKFKFVKEYTNSINYSVLKKTMNVANSLKKDITKIENNLDNEKIFIDDNKELLINISIKPLFKGNKFRKKTDFMVNNRGLKYNNRMIPAVAKTGWLIFFFVLMIFTLKLNTLSKTTDFKIAFRDYVKNASYELSRINLKANKNYITISEADVFAKNNPESLVLYHIPANQKSVVIDNGNNGNNEKFAKISFMTEYGSLKGWINKESIEMYNPNNDSKLEKLTPIKCTSSSEFMGKKYYGPSNAADGDYSTSWQEGAEGNGIGEWISFNYGDTKEISAIGIYNGSGGGEEPFYANVRPIKITVYFYVDDSLKDSLSYKLDDGIMDVQYIDLNKTVSANSIKIKIDSVGEGNKYQDACIAEIEVYSVLQVEQH